MKNLLNDKNQPSASLIAWIAYFFVVMFLFYEMALQISPSIITHELMHDLQIDASWLGIISGIYFYPYMFMQLPMGLLFDRYSLRQLIPTAILICVAGTLLFVISHNIVTAISGRFLMGIGSAAAFISVLMVSSRWFPTSYFTLLVGITQFFGAAGAIGGEIPLSMLTHAWGWRTVFAYLVIAGILLAFCVWLILKFEPKSSYQKENLSIHNNLIQGLKIVLHNSQSWWLAVYTFCCWGPVAAFASLWGVPYLMTLYHLNKIQAATACSMVWFGFMLGSPIIGFLANYFQRRLIFLRGMSFMGLVAALLILYLPGIPLPMMWIALFSLGIATSTQVLTFALAKQQHSSAVTATAISFNNMAAIASAAILQPLIGFILHSIWSGKSIDYVAFYSVSNYQIALVVIPICFIISSIISSFFIQEPSAAN